MIKPKLILLLLIFSGICCYSFGQIDTINNVRKKNSTLTDNSIFAENTEELKQLEEKIAPYIEQALKTLPDTKRRFLNGLKQGESLCLVIRIYDIDGKFEQVFVFVKKWENDKIKGNITNDLHTVKEYLKGQLIEFKEKDVLDWVISKPDGSQEGNFVGSFLETLRK